MKSQKFQSPEVQVNKAGEFTEEEVKRLESLVTDLNQLVSDKMYSEDNLRIVLNLAAELQVIQETFITRLLWLYKRGYKIN